VATYEAGTAVLEVVPSFLGIEQMLAKGARDIAQGLDKALGGQLGKAMESATEKAEKSTDRAGRKLGQVFAERALKQVETALGNIPESDRILKPLREELQALSEIDLGKGFDERKFIARLEKVHDALKRAKEDAQGINAVGRYTNAGNAAEAIGSARQMIDAARKRGYESGDAWTNAFQSRLRAMRTALPDLKIRAGSTQEERARASTPDERQAAAIRSRIEAVQALKPGDIAQEGNPLSLPIGVKISREDLAREMGSIEGILDNFIESFQDSDLVFPVDKARQQAGAFFDDVKTQGEKAAEAEAQAYLKAWEDAHREQAKRDRQFREERGRLEDEALKEDFKRARRARDERDKMRDAALLEDYKFEKRQRDDFEKAREAALKEDFLRQKRVRDDYQKAFDDAIKADYLRQKRVRDDFAKSWDDAQLEDYKRRLRARDEFSRTWDAAQLEDYKRDKRTRDEFAKMWDDAQLEDYRVQRRRLEEFNRDQIAAYKENARRRADSLRGTTAGNAQEGTRKAAGLIQEIPVHLQSRSIDREMAAIRTRIEKLGKYEIGVHVKSEDFADDIEREFRRLKAIVKDQKVDIKVRTDAAAAATELGGILVLLNRIDGDKATVKVDTSGAVSSLGEMLGSLSLSLGRLGALIATGASLGTALVPAAAAAASAIGAIGTAALAAGSGIGVMMLGFSGIGEAVKAMGQLADDKQKSKVSTNKGDSGVAAALDQIKSAERALAETRRNNANAATKAARAVREALEDQKATVVSVARANQDATEKYKDAQRDATRAGIDAEKAQLGLVAAYAAARRELEDLHSALRGNALDQRQAALDIIEAKEKLDKMLLNPRATVAEREQADITYQQRMLQLDDLKRKGGELSDEQEKRFRVGLKGTEEVKKAEEDIADANERASDAQRALQRAEQDVSRTREEGQHKIRDAAQKVADAQAAQAEQQKDAAYSLFTANQSLIAAQRALKNAYDRSSVAGGAALDNVRTAMGKLSPTAQKFAEYIFGLRDAFYALRRAADPMLAGAQRAMESLFGKTSKDAIRNLQPVFDFVHRVAGALGDIFTRFAATLKGPTFTRFFRYVSDTAVPTLEKMYDAFENILIGVTNLFLAFTPLTEDITDGFVGMTASFRKWSEGLQTNTGFQEFLDYLRASGPKVMNLAKSLLRFLGKLVVAAAPIGDVVVEVFTRLFEAINKIPQDTLTHIVAALATAAAAIAAIAGVTAVASLETAGVISAVIGAAVAGLAFLVGNLKPLRDAIVSVFRSISNALSWWWENYTKPVLTAMGKMYSFVFGEIVGPVLSGLFKRLKIMGENTALIFNRYVLPALRQLGEVLRPLWSHVIKPALGLIAGGFLLLWTKVLKPILAWWNGDLDELSKKNSAFLRILIPALDALAKMIGFLWRFIIRPWLKGWVILLSALVKAIEGWAKQWFAFGSRVAGVIDFINKTWAGFGNGLLDVWRTKIQPVLKSIAEWMEKSGLVRVFSALSTGLNLVGAAAQTGRGIAKDQPKKTAPGFDASGTAATAGTAAVKIGALARAITGVGEATRQVSPAQARFAAVQKVLGDRSATAAQKVEAVKSALEEQQDATVNAIEADEDYNGSLISLRSQVNQAKEAHDRHAKSLSMNSETGLRNRDALEALVDSANRAYDADVALNGVTERAVKTGKDRIKEIRETARQLGLNKDQTNDLIKAYNRVPDNVETAVGFKKGQFDKMFAQLEQAAFIQEALRKNQSLKDARHAYKTMVSDRNRAAAHGWGDGYGLPGYRSGGPISGPGTKTSDSVLMWGSRGEFMQPAHTVDYYGMGIMEALRRRLIPKELLQGLASGGPVNVKWPFPLDMAKTFIPSAEDLQKAVYGGAFNGTLGGQRGGRGWQWQMSVLRKVFAGLALISGPRPGSRTLSGNLSYHSQGRAVDLPPIRSVAEWIARTYGASSKELITPWRDLMLWNGRPHKYSRAIEAQHGVFGQNRHIHWAYERGGLLPDTRNMPGGVMQVFHGRKTPDKVLTDNQWQNMATLANKARESMRGGDTYNFPYRDTTLDIDELNRWTSRRDALNRVNRVNY
jgi:hypothetical protein